MDGFCKDGRAKMIHAYHAERHAMWIRTLCGARCHTWPAQPPLNWEIPPDGYRRCPVCERERA